MPNNKAVELDNTLFFNKQANSLIYILKDALQDITLIAWLHNLQNYKMELIRQHFPHSVVMEMMKNFNSTPSKSPISTQKELWELLKHNRQFRMDLYQNEALIDEASMSLNFRNSFERFIDAAESVLKNTNAEATSKKARLSEAIEKTKKSIHLNKTHFDEELKEYNNYIAEKLQHVEQTHQRLNEHQESFLRKIDVYSMENEVRIRNEIDNNLGKINLLQEKAGRQKHNLSTLLVKHIQLNKEIRSQKDKLEQQLEQWLIVYDREMTQRQQQFDELLQLYNEAVDEFGDLNSSITRHQNEYEEYIREKDLREQEWYTKKLVAFMEMRSAKIIQRAWRTYRARKKHKKRTKSKKIKS